MKHKGRSLLILFLLLLEVYGKLLSTKTSSKKSWRNQEYQPVIKDEEEETLGAYAEMATYLKRYGQKNGFKDYSLDEIENTLSSLATAQATWKSMDGLTHQLKNTFKKSSSLQSRYENFIDKKKKNTKEAAKLREYVTTVERGMQACEILQTVSINDPMERKESLLQANLTEISRFPLHYNKLHCTVSFLLPIPDNTENNTDYSQISPELQAYGRDELVIAITDDVKKASISIAQLLRLMSFESPVPITIPSQDEPFFIQPTLLELSLKVCEHLSSFLSRVKASNTQSTSDGDTAEHLIDQLNDITHQKSTLIKRPPKRFRVIGYSAGGGVASYFSMILDGALDIKSYFQAKSASSSSSTTTDSLTNTTSNSFNETSSVKEEIDDVSSLFGKYRNRIRTMVIGPPPCISRNIVPKFISCIIHGDDVISRTQTSSISQFQQRMKKALKGGAGKASSWGWMLNTGLIQDVKTVAGKSLSRYKVAKKDAKNINLPGRVFFIKSRKYKQGATIQRVLRGNWQEDILWNLHDILISEKMFQHHSIESFIKTLARC